MTEPIPAVHQVGDPGHTTDHNAIVQVLSDYLADITNLQGSVTALQAGAATAFSTAGGNACPIPGAATDFATVTVTAVNRDASPDLLDFFYGTQKVFTLNSYGEVRIYPSQVAHIPFIIQALTGQTADLLDILASDGVTKLVQVTAAGNVVTTGNVRVGADGTGVVNATDPVNGGVAEQWHNFILNSGWGTTTNNGVNDTPQYKLLPDGAVALRGSIVTPPSGAAMNVNFATIPAPYRPAAGGRIPYAPILTTIGGTAGQIYIVPSGGVRLNSSAWGNSYNILIDATLRIN
jgi:hypothetical protein